MATFRNGDIVETDKGIGTVAFFGSTQFADGVWVGIILNEPKGKNNGSVKGVSYFTCDENCGIFVQRDKVRLKNSTTPKPKPTAASHIRAPTNVRKPSNTRIPSISSLTTPSGTPRITPASSMEKISGIDRQKSFGTKVSQSINQQLPRLQKLEESQQATPKPTPSKQLSQSGKAPNIDSCATPSIVKEKAQKIDEKFINSPVDASIFKLPESGSVDLVEIDYLRKENKDLNEKVETLRLKRREDVEKLEEYKRIKIQLERLQVYQEEMSRAHSELQRERDDLTQKIEDYELERKQRSDISRLMHQLESVTLDREMAEEKSELLKTEIEVLQQTLQDREDELSLLRDELEKKDLASGGTSEGGGGAVQAVQLKQLQQENTRLREAIVKVRDAFTQASKDLEDAKKDLEDANYEREELILTLERQVLELENAKVSINDFREQVDAAMGSEKMISTLTDKNLNLEERIRQLEDDIQGLEELKAMDEEIIDSQKEIERDLKEDNERNLAVISDLRRQLADFDKCAKDYEQVISRFRQKNAELNEQIQQLQDEILIMKSQEEEARSVGQINESFSLKVVSANRTFSEIVDSEVKLVELEFSRQQSIYLKSFLPDNFTKPGGDNDSVLLCIFFPRIVKKAEVLAKLLNMKYPPVPGGLRREHITLSHKAEQWAHVKKFSYSLKALCSIAKKFEFVVNNCTVERLSRLAVQQLEITGQERNLDMLLELLRQNRLDENTSVDNLDRIINFLQKIYATNLTAESANAKDNLSDVIDQLKEGLAWDLFNCERLSYFLQQTDKESSEFAQFVHEFTALVVESESLTIRARNRIPAENDLIISLEMNEKIINAVTALERTTRLIHNTCSFAASQLSTTDVEGFSSVQMKEMLHSSVEKFMGATDSNRATAIIIENIKVVKLFLSEISEQLDNSSMEIPPPAKNNFPPLLERAHMRKNDIVEAESLRWQLSKKDEEIVKLQKLVKLREGDISTFKVRLEMADKQIANTDKSGDLQTQHLRTRCDQLQEDFVRQKNEYETKLAELNARLRQALEERDKERQHGHELAKNSLVHDVHQNILNSSIASLNTSAAMPGDGTMAALEFDIRRLQKKLCTTLNDLRWAEHRIRMLETQNARKLLNELEDISLPDFICGINSMYQRRKKTDEDHDLKKMMREVDALIQKTNGCLIEPVDPRERAMFKVNVANINERIDTLKFRFHRFWNQTHPGEELPILVNDLISKARPVVKTCESAKPQQRCRMILDKWNSDLKKNGPYYEKLMRQASEKAA